MCSEAVDGSALMPASGAHVIVGMSGGVDSSVTALLLQRAGYAVSGVFMQNWEDDDEACTARQDYRDAAGVADALGIPLETVNFADEYWSGVFEHFLAEYQAGRTPNPDILCNREIKFKAFLEHADRRGAAAIATGHYVRRGLAKNGDWELLRGLDSNKDQSYFLHQLGQKQIASSLFPVGELEKSRVRSLARSAGLHVHTKKDSTGICFIGERKFTSFLSEYLPHQPGEIIDETGTVIGRHTGLMYHTLGQRQGLGIGGRQGSGDAPWYVLDKDLENNRLIVGQGHDNPRLLRRQLGASDVHWVNGRTPNEQLRCTARVRYRQTDVPATLTCHYDGLVSLMFDEPVRAMTPGQSVVFYDEERCLGGGVINMLGRAENG